MQRPVFPNLVLAGLILCLAAQSAEALPKSFCRRWAAGVANNNVGYEEQARAAGKGPVDLESFQQQDPAKAAPLAGSGLGGALHRMTKPARWHEIYEKAYAHCRVVQN